MDLTKLYRLLNATTVQLRKGEVVRHENHGGIEVVTIDMMPHESEARPEIEKVDMVLLTIGVDKQAAERHRAELIALLNEYPAPEELATGPSYIAVGARIGDQGTAFQLFALGQVLGLWKVITPATFGLDGDAAIKAAGAGYVMITGYAQKGQQVMTDNHKPGT